jgi:hypothetical protein
MKSGISQTRLAGRVHSCSLGGILNTIAALRIIESTFGSLRILQEDRCNDSG